MEEPKETTGGTGGAEVRLLMHLKILLGWSMANIMQFAEEVRSFSWDIWKKLKFIKIVRSWTQMTFSPMRAQAFGCVTNRRIPFHHLLLQVQKSFL